MSAVRVTDSSLRDGSHTVAHSFSGDQVAAIAGRLDAAGVPVIEVSHGDGLGGSSFNYGFSTTDERRLIAVARETCEQATIAVLLLPGIGTKHDLEAARERGAGLVRVATHCTEADISAQHIERAAELGMEVNGFLMMSHMASPAELTEQALLMESYGAETVYVVDSAGAMVPDTARERVVALREALDPATHVGFHAHDNLGCAVGNSLAAIAAGADRIDSSLGGLGAGAGNLASELFAAAAERSGIATGLDVMALANAAEEILKMLEVQPNRSRESLVIGYAGVYSSFLLHAERAGARFGVDPAEVLLELGRRRVVGGQEDMIIDVAAGLNAPQPT